MVSACLAGMKCRYDGGANPCPEVQELVRQGSAVPVCPEVLAGLSVPRLPCEMRQGRIVSQDGSDITEAFERGAQAALAEALRQNCTAAVLKSRSPSCGFGRIYDGSFSRTLCRGEGVWAKLLREAGFALYSEEQLPPESTPEFTPDGMPNSSGSPS